MDSPFIITTLTLFCNPSYLSLHTGTCIFHISKISYNKIFVITVMIIIVIRINQSNLINYNCNIRTVIITEIYYCLKQSIKYIGKYYVTTSLELQMRYVSKTMDDWLWNNRGYTIRGLPKP